MIYLSLIKLSKKIFFLKIFCLMIMMIMDMKMIIINIKRIMIIMIFKNNIDYDDYNVDDPYNDLYDCYNDYDNDTINDNNDYKDYDYDEYYNVTYNVYYYYS